MHQGWENYATWAVHLWLTNDEPSYNLWTDQALTVWENSEADDIFTRSEVARRELAESLKAAVEEDVPLDGGSLYSDLLESALDDVQWGDVANAWLEPLDGYEPSGR